MRRRGRLFALSVAIAVAIPVLAVAIVLLLADGYLQGAEAAELGGDESGSPENQCAQQELIRLERDGGIPMDARTGHGAAVDEILRTCAGEPGLVAAEGLEVEEPQGQP